MSSIACVFPGQGSQHPEMLKTNLVDQSFINELDMYRRDYIGRPSPLYFAERLTEYFGGAKKVKTLIEYLDS